MFFKFSYKVLFPVNDFFSNNKPTLFFSADMLNEFLNSIVIQVLNAIKNFKLSAYVKTIWPVILLIKNNEFFNEGPYESKGY